MNQLSDSEYYYLVSVIYKSVGLSVYSTDMEPENNTMFTWCIETYINNLRYTKKAICKVPNEHNMNRFMLEILDFFSELYDYVRIYDNNEWEFIALDDDDGIRRFTRCIFNNRKTENPFISMVLMLHSFRFIKSNDYRIDDYKLLCSEIDGHYPLNTSCIKIITDINKILSDTFDLSEHPDAILFKYMTSNERKVSFYANNYEKVSDLILESLYSGGELAYLTLQYKIMCFRHERKYSDYNSKGSEIFESIYKSDDYIWRQGLFMRIDYTLLLDIIDLGDITDIKTYGKDWVSTPEITDRDQDDQDGIIHNKRPLMVLSKNIDNQPKKD